MTLAIQSTSSFFSPVSTASFFTDLQDKVSEVFAKIKEVIILPEDRIPVDRPVFDLRPLYEQPAEIIEGLFYGAFWVLSAYFAASSCYDLYETCAVEHLPQEKFEKIGSAVKTAFVDILSFGSSVAYTARWADTAKIISLGRYVPLVSHLCFGATIVGSTVEAGADIYNIWVEKEAILEEQPENQREEHKQLLCYALMKLVGNVSIVAWAFLGIAALVGVAVSPALTGILLGVSCVVGVSAIFYKIGIEESKKRGVFA